MTEQELRDMKCGDVQESVKSNTDRDIERVPNGWIFWRRLWDDNQQSVSISGVFVPEPPKERKE